MSVVSQIVSSAHIVSSTRTAGAADAIGTANARSSPIVPSIRALFFFIVSSPISQKLKISYIVNELQVHRIAQYN
ncbi:MAG: hypothetical protein ACW98A_17435 [Candidatus Hodarchaeales archaeon]